MFKPILQLAAVGLAGFALWKLGSFFFIPLLFLALKLALVVGLVLFAIAIRVIGGHLAKRARGPGVGRG